MYINNVNFKMFKAHANEENGLVIKTMRSDCEGENSYLRNFKKV